MLRDVMERVTTMFAAVFLLSRLLLAQATSVFEHPQDVTMQPNEWANFSCTVHCGLFPVKWHKAGLENPIVAGLEFKIFNNSTCNSEDKATYILEVLATNASNNSAFYCAAYESCIGCPQTNCKCGCFGRCYSRPAFLIVEKMDAAVTTTLHPTPSSLHPEQGTVTPEVTRKTLTVTPTPTNCPTSAVVPALTSLQATSTSLQTASTQAAILAGLGIAASILLI